MINFRRVYEDRDPGEKARHMNLDAIRQEAFTQQQMHY